VVRTVLSVLRSADPGAPRRADPVLDLNAYAVAEDVELTLVLKAAGVELAVAGAHVRAATIGGLDVAAAAAEEQLLAAFAVSGWKAGRQPFALQETAAEYGRVVARLFPDATGQNVVAMKRGTAPAGLVLVGAHHDTLPETPGADDNGAGLVGLVEVARLLAPLPLRHDVALVAFDFEEIGFHGARAFLARLPDHRRVLGAIVFETMAYVSRDPGSQQVPAGMGLLFPRQVRRLRRRGLLGDWTAVIYRRQSAELAVHLAQAVQALEGADAAMILRDPVDLPVAGSILKWAFPLVRNFARSDHIPFWKRGLPAVQVTDTANFRNPHYHTPTDTPDTVDYDRLAAIVAATAAVVEDLAR
jgi:hypothetical protein